MFGVAAVTESLQIPLNRQNLNSKKQYFYCLIAISEGKKYLAVLSNNMQPLSVLRVYSQKRKSVDVRESIRYIKTLN